MSDRTLLFIFFVVSSMALIYIEYFADDDAWVNQLNQPRVIEQE